MQLISVKDIEKSAVEAENLLSLLANRHRLMILCHLVDGDHTVTELLNKASLSQSALSQHLAKLREAELVSALREGQSVRYALASEQARKLIETLCTLYKR